MSNHKLMLLLLLFFQRSRSALLCYLFTPVADRRHKVRAVSKMPQNKQQ